MKRQSRDLPRVESALAFVFVFVLESCVADEGTEVANMDTFGLAEVDIMILLLSQTRLR
jgi:hypothetical protein